MAPPQKKKAPAFVMKADALSLCVMYKQEIGWDQFPAFTYNASEYPGKLNNQYLIDTLKFSKTISNNINWIFIIVPQLHFTRWA